MMSGLLFVDTYEYVDGEEHDAKIMFSGTLLDSKILYGTVKYNFLMLIDLVHQWFQ